MIHQRSKIHKYNNYNIIEIYINRLSYNANFHSDGSLDPGIFSHPVEATGFMYFMNYFLSYVHLKDLYKNLK